jgi:superfamily II DNA or RNA helicase
MKRGSNSSNSKSTEKPVLPYHFGFSDYIGKKFVSFKLDPQDMNDDPCLARKQSKDEIKTLFPYQKFIGAYLNNNNPYRGLLLYHGLGSGKTMTAIATAEGMKDERDIIVLTPASLRDNFIGEIIKFALSMDEDNKKKLKMKSKDEIMKTIEKKYTFYSYNASNFMKKFKECDLNNKVLVVDEVHNLISMIVGNGKQGEEIYSKIMSAKNLRIVLLSGTPLVNTPYEAAAIFNLISGYMNADHTEWDGTGKKYSLFPENPDVFYDQYIDETDPSMFKLKNRDEFVRRIYGLVSYYAGLQGKSVYPDLLMKPIQYIPMSEYQFIEYERIRQIEADKEAKMKTNYSRMISAGDSEDKSPHSLFRIYSRQVSNFAFPQEIPRPYPYADFNKGKNKKKEDEEVNNEVYHEKLDKALNKLQRHGSEYLSAEKIKDYSPKMLQIIKNFSDIQSSENSDINSFQRGTIVVYSFFKSVEGARIFSMALEENGYADYRNTSVADYVPRYAIFNGKEDYDMLNNIFNSPENKYGFRIKVLIITSSGAEGISLQNVRQVHIMEPYWNEVQIRQVIGRAKRICSHYDLPNEDRNISVYRYISIFDKKQKSMAAESETTDQFIYKIAQNKERLMDEIQNIMKQTAVDCQLNYQHNIADSENKNLKCTSFGVPDASMRFKPIYELVPSTGKTGKMKKSDMATDKKTNDIVMTKKSYKGIKAFDKKGNVVEVYIIFDPSKDKLYDGLKLQAFSKLSIEEKNPKEIGEVVFDASNKRFVYSPL